MQEEAEEGQQGETSDERKHSQVNEQEGGLDKMLSCLKFHSLTRTPTTTAHTTTPTPHAHTPHTVCLSVV